MLGSPTFFLELCIDIYFLVDIFLNFRTGFYDMHTGDLRIDQRSITAHYMKGWCAAGPPFFSVLVLVVTYCTRIFG